MNVVHPPEHKGIIVITCIALAAVAMAAWAQWGVTQQRDDFKLSCRSAVSSRNRINADAHLNVLGWSAAAWARWASYQRGHQQSDLRAATAYASIVRRYAFLSIPNCAKGTELASLWNLPPPKPTLPRAIR